MRYRHLLSGGGQVHSNVAYPQLGVRPGQRVLDVACGFGENSLELATHVGPTGSVLGLDCTPAFIEIALRERLAARVRNVDYTTADIETAALPGASFDLAVSRFGLMYCASPVRALCAIARALRHYQSALRVFAELDKAKERELTANWHALRGTKSEGGSVDSMVPPKRPRWGATTVDLSQKLATSPPLVGRASEREELFQTLADVTRTRRTQLLLLTGEPGIGKSRLVDELLLAARQQGYTVLDGAAYECESGRPYGPWIDALHKVKHARLGFHMLGYVRWEAGDWEEARRHMLKADRRSLAVRRAVRMWLVAHVRRRHEATAVDLCAFG